MKHEFQYEPLNENYLDAALALVMAEYNEEKMAVSFLPEDKEFLNPLKDSIRSLLINGTGVMAVCCGELLGFIAGFEVGELFGKCKGIYSPLYGHGVKKECRIPVYQELYRYAAETWVKEHYMTHVLTFFAHDKETIELWFWQGFGMRCVDAIRETLPMHSKNTTVMIRKLSIGDIPILADIHRKHIRYYKDSPIFMPKTEREPVQELAEWLARNNHHLWAAYQGEKPVGYMRIEPNAEIFISEHKDIMNITGAYVLENARKTGAGTKLLATIQNWLLNNGYPLCGVDFESINTMGSGFWNKYFTPYTYSLVRRIDERIIVDVIGYGKADLARKKDVPRMGLGCAPDKTRQ